MSATWCGMRSISLLRRHAVPRLCSCSAAVRAGMARWGPPTCSSVRRTTSSRVTLLGCLPLCSAPVLAALLQLQPPQAAGRFWCAGSLTLAHEYTSTACRCDRRLGLLRCPQQAHHLLHVLRFAVSPRPCTARLPFLCHLHLSLGDRRTIRSLRRL